MVKSVAATLVLASLLAAAPAAADTFRGTTSQGRDASLVTGPNGLPVRVRVSWRTTCERPGYTATGGTLFVPPYTAVSADTVQDRAKSYRVRIPGGLRVRVTTDLVVNRSGRRWVGTLSVHELFGRRGKVTDVCEAERIRFVLS